MKVPARVISESEHQINQDHIDADALYVLNRLNQSGFEAYLVGGGVRDLLLGQKPKDFDIATNAQPREVKKKFRNCWLVGRRFRLAHVKFGPQGERIVEVSTFRRSPDPQTNEDVPLLADDNLFGTAAEDAHRRDFTINALFYSAQEAVVLDFTGGYKDLKNKVVRSIGDPRVRFQEDPVRMLRAIKFSRRLNFSLSGPDQEALEEFHPLLGEVSSSRLTDEMYKVFKTGTCQSIFEGFMQSELLASVAPGMADLIRAGGCLETLRKVDEEEKLGNSLERSQIWALVIAPSLSEIPVSQNIPHFPQVDQHIFEYVEKSLKKLRVSRRDRDQARQILRILYRIKHAKTQRLRERVLHQPFFSQALRVWELQDKDEEEREKFERWDQLWQSKDFLKKPKPRRRRRPHRRRRPVP